MELTSSAYWMVSTVYLNYTESARYIILVGWY